MIGTLLIWGLITNWWSMAGISIVAVLTMTGIFRANARPCTLTIVLIMVPAIDKKIKSLTAFQNEAEQRVIEQVRKSEDFVILLNTDQQLFQGTDGEGNPIRPPYRPFTVQLKRIKNQPTDRVTLLDTGDFYKGMLVLYGSNEFRLINIDEKAQKLRTKYGDNILGLNERSRDLLA